jgi:hypothetical protein
MEIRELFVWSPYLALVLGFIAGLGALHSLRRLTILTACILFIQVVGWAALFVVFDGAHKGWTASWQAALEAGFFWGLLVAFCYSVLGVVVGGVVAALIRRSGSSRKV